MPDRYATIAASDLAGYVLLLYRTGDAHGGLARLGKHEEVVGLAYKQEASAFQFLIQIIEKDVR